MRQFNLLRCAAFQAACVAVGALSATLPVRAADSAPRNLMLQAVTAPVRTEQRLALVIGNSAYKDAPLVNPVNDAKAMAKALQASGFTVVLLTDVDHRTLLGAVRDFGTRLRQGGTGVFYFAGHGMQIKGRNYLIPVGADIQREDEVAYSALDAQAVLDKMESAGNGVNLMILDACRNNPFTRSFRSSVQGLAQMEAPVGTLVAFSTAPGGVASDGQGANGLYTQHLLKAMSAPGAKVEDVFKQARAAVRRDSQGKQVPWEVTSLEGDLYFVVPPAPVVPQKPDATSLLEDALWDTVKDSKEPAELKAYLRRFPQGRHAAQALLQLSALAPGRIATAASAARAPAQAAVNAGGYTVGDKWNYQVLDKQKGEVIRNYSLQVGKMLPDGSWTTPSGQAEFDAFGRWKKIQRFDGEERVSAPFAARWWPGMKVGETRRFAYRQSGTPREGKPWTNQQDFEGRVVRIETVKVPAGEFQAHRIELTGTSTPVGRPGGGTGTSKGTYWYVPELHTLVAYEGESTWDGKLVSREREELTSFLLVNSPAPR